MPHFTISASILSADFARLGEEVNAVLSAGADSIHFDVMDNHYVPNLTVGPMVCKALRNYGITAPIDVHLMVEPVDRLIEDFAKAGASAISFHPEASQDVDRSLQLIREYGCKAGVALNPATPLSCLDYILEYLDHVLLMSVNPGFGGQAFIESSFEKIQETRELLTASQYPIHLAVDGGVNQKNLHAVAHAGADTLVMGSAIFNSTDYVSTMAALRAELSR